MIQERIPPVPKDRFELMLKRLVQRVNALSDRSADFTPDETGAFQIGDVNIIQVAQADGTIRVSLQNAVTLGPPVELGILS